ncbi:ScbR family autoregulator-binding transcription factor [Streptacidiphilus rugosus]|uniref:ScbR family autoregulator-binding transcription factor n=1 Tax=Streptacidiphilus rugosus TaxID=405783 RepID=UPI000AF61321|nr:ScbR family autoregulator-binding transcription factor [Streptacidiphilus rugosus]
MTAKISMPGWTGPSTEGMLPDIRQDRAIQTRAHILRAAAHVFAEKGFKSSSVLDVAHQVGMTKGAIYFHFPTKEILAVAVVEEHYSRWPQLLERILEDDLSPLETAIAMLDGAAEAFANDIVVQAGARLQLESSVIDADLPQPYVGWMHLLTQLLDAALAEGQLRDDVDPAAVARALVGGFFGVQHVSAVLTGRSDLQERWAELRDLIVARIQA